MRETSKAAGRRLGEGWWRKYLIDDGIDIGCGDDPITPTCRRWDIADGDAQLMDGVPAESFAWVYSSHCLEHLRDPAAALARWWELLRPGGCLLLAVPDADLYEQGVWPSRWNSDHKWTFGVWTACPWSPVHLNLTDLLTALPGARIISIRQIDCGYDYRLRDTDQTLTGAEAAVEAIVRKLPA